MASTDARAVPRKNVAYRATFPIMDAEGDLVTGATGLDSEISKDGGTFADVTAEATEIATASGIYYLDLTSTEMNADTVAIIVKTTSSGAKTTVLVMYPEEAGDYRADVVQYLGAAAPALVGGRYDSSTGAMAANVLTATAINADAITAAKIADGAIDAATLATGTITAAKFAAGAIDAAAIANGAIDAATFAAGAIDAAALAADAGTEIGTAVWATTTRVLTAGTNIVLAKGVGVTGFTDLSAAQVNTEVDTAIADAALATAASLATVAGYIDTEIGAIITAVADVPTNAELATALGTADDAVLAQIALVKAKTDAMPTDPADQSLIIAATDAIFTAIGALNNITAASVWAAGTRTLTSGAGIVLAKGTGVTGFNDITAAAVLGAGDVDGFTLEETQKLLLAAMAGKVSGAGTTTVTIRAADDSKDRITATVTAAGARTAITLDETG